MIRLFSDLCKCFNKINSKNEIETFNFYIDSLDVNALVCPFCGAKHSLTIFASYQRHLVTYSEKVTSDHNISISRGICSSCGHTHAILPSVIIPYMSFSFGFTISIIRDYLVNTFPSVKVMCENYGIAITTFYRVFKKFKEHKKLWLGLMKDFLISHLSFINDLLKNSFIELEQFISAFFIKTALSFLQGNVILCVT